MKTSYIWTIVVVILLCANSIFLFMMWHQKRNDDFQSPRQTEIHTEVKDFLVKELALTPKQMVLFDTLRTRHHKSMDSLNDKTHHLKDSLFGYLSKPAVSSATTTTLTHQIGTNSALIDEVTFTHFQQLRTILDVVQQKKFDSIIMRVIDMMAHQGQQRQRDRGPGEFGRGSFPHSNEPDKAPGRQHNDDPDGMGRPPVGPEGNHRRPPPPEDHDDIHHGPPPDGPPGVPPPGEGIHEPPGFEQPKIN